jgi:DNA replication and repair protein RecF
VILIGENGVGKTNLLEAISLFFPGRGIRSAKLDEICKYTTDHWTVSALFQSKIGFAEIRNNFNIHPKKRIIEFNGSKISNSELSKLSSMVWITPQMEGIFLDSPTIRRKFFDRIVYNFDHSHAANVHEYEHYIHERINFLRQDYPDESWLKIIEEKISKVSLAIAKNRISVLNQLQKAINNISNEFPKANLAIEGSIESKLELDDLEIISFIQSKLCSERLHDKLSGRTNFGVHRSDFIVIHNDKNILAKFCSTGEQKALLISLVLAQLNAGIVATGYKPILLMDEIFVHLDDRRKQYLIDFFLNINLQVWITATDLNGIENFANVAHVIRL